MYGSGPTLIKTGIAVYPNPASTTLNLNIAPGFNSNSGTSFLAAQGVSYDIQVANILGIVVIKTTTAQQKLENRRKHPNARHLHVIKVINNKDNIAVGQATFIKL